MAKKAKPMAERRHNYKELKNNTEFQQHLLKIYSVDTEKGVLKGPCYHHVGVSLYFKGKIFRLTSSHLVWFLTYKVWPREGYEIDHKDDNSLNNRPDNLQELTKADNNAKRKGKTTGKFGSGKYGYGISIGYDKKRNKYAARRSYEGRSRERVFLFRADTIEELEMKIAEYIKDIDTVGDIEDIFS